MRSHKLYYCKSWELVAPPMPQDSSCPHMDQWIMQIMAQAERLSHLAAERQALIAAGLPACDMSGTMLGMQDRHVALADAIIDTEARISDVQRQKQDSQERRGKLHKPLDLVL